MRQIAKNVFYESSFRGANVGLIVTKDGVVSVDTPMLPMLAVDWRRRSETFGPMRYVVNTDHLQEHMMGNYFLPGDVIAHDETRGRMRMTDKAREQYFKFVLNNDVPGVENLIAHFELRYPNITLFDRLTVHLGGRALEFIHLPGHASNNIGVYLADARILFAGDTVVNNYRAYLGLSSIPDWLMTLKALEVMDVDWIIPGHGDPVRPNQLGPLTKYLERMRGRVQHLIDSGRARDEVVSKMMPYFEEWPIDNTRRDEERNLYRQGVRQIYDKLTGRRK